MGNGVTGLLFGLGFGVWVYAIMMRQTGGLAQQSIVTAAIAGVVGFFVVFTLLASFF